MTEVIVKLHALRRTTRWRPKTDSFIQYKHTSYAGYVLWINIFVPSLEAASSFLNASQKNVECTHKFLFSFLYRAEGVWRF